MRFYPRSVCGHPKCLVEANHDDVVLEALFKQTRFVTTPALADGWNRMYHDGTRDVQ